MADRNLPDVRRNARGPWNPAREMNRLQRNINRMFDDFWTDPFSSFFRPTTGLAFESEEFVPACDVDETDSHYLVSFDLPGVKKDDVKVQLKDNQLTVSGERKEEKKKRGSRESYYGSFFRSIALPPNVKPEDVEANFENGVLQICIPKTAVSAGKQIPIKEGKLIEQKTEKPEKTQKAA